MEITDRYFRTEKMKLKFFKKAIICERLIDVKNQTLLREEKSKGVPIFNFQKNQLLYSKCISSKKTVYHIMCENRSTYFVMLIPMNQSGKEMIMECIFDVSNNLYINSAELSDRKLYTFNQLSKLIYLDELTGLYNRRYIDEKLPMDVEAAVCHKEPISFLFADIDDFKMINDTYGHFAGDFILKEISILLNKHINKTKNWAARYGGDEFLISLNGVNHIETNKIKSEIKNEIALKSFVYHEHGIKVTCCFGMYTIDDDIKPRETEEIFDWLDKTLYREKEVRNTEKIK